MLLYDQLNLKFREPIIGLRARGAEMNKLGLLFFVVICLVFTASCIGKDVPVTETKPAVEETSENTTAPAAIPLTITDNFRTSYSGWGQGYIGPAIKTTENLHLMEFESTYEEGEYSIFIGAHKLFDYRRNSVIGAQQDFIVEVDARTMFLGPNAAGIVFRGKSDQGQDSFYVFLVNSGHRTYAIKKYIKGAWAPDLIESTKSYYIDRDPYYANRLEVTCKGSQIEVYVNDHKLTTVTDTSLTSGFIGLAVERANSFLDTINYLSSIRNFFEFVLVYREHEMYPYIVPTGKQTFHLRHVQC